MYKLKWTRLQFEIFRFLSVKAGTSLNLRSIARLLGRSPTAVSKSLIDLENEGFVKIERANNINLLSIEFNRDNKKAIELKRVENLRLIYESGLAEFLEESFPGCVVILFGSYSRGEDTTSSDIDIAVIGSDSENLNLTKYSKKLERTVFVNFYRSFDKIHKNLKDNILNGIVLSGFVNL